jgi:hypothetical protein
MKIIYCTNKKINEETNTVEIGNPKVYVNVKCLFFGGEEVWGS